MNTVKLWMARLTWPLWAPLVLLGSILLCALLLYLDKDEEL